MVLSHPWVRHGGSAQRLLVTPQNIRRNNSARELSAFAESAMAVKRVVLQHMSINLEEDFSPDNNDKEVLNSSNGINMKPPMGLSPPSESKILQRRRNNADGSCSQVERRQNAGKENSKTSNNKYIPSF